MPRIVIPLAGSHDPASAPTYPGAAAADKGAAVFDPQTLINLSAEPDDGPGGKQAFALRSVHGVDSFLIGYPPASSGDVHQYIGLVQASVSDLGDAMAYIRRASNFHLQWGRLVGGSFLPYAASSVPPAAFSTTYEGGPASTAADSKYLYAIIKSVVGGNFLHYTAIATISTVGPQFLDVTTFAGAGYIARTVEVIGNYTVICCNGAASATPPRIHVSAPGNGISYNALDFVSFDAIPGDSINETLVIGDDLWVFGGRSIEVWGLNSGASGFPLSRIRGATQTFGAERGSVAKINSTGFFVTSSASGGRSVMAIAGGYSPVKISTNAIDDAISLAQTFTAAAYEDGSRAFYVLDTGTETFVYSLQAKAWHKRLTATGDNLGIVNMVGRRNTTLGTQETYAMHTKSGYAFRYACSKLVPGATVNKQRTLPHLFNDRTRRAYNSFELEMQLETSGVGGASTVSLSWSNDGGKSFNTPIPITLHDGSGNDDKLRRIKWNRLGSARDRVFRLDFPVGYEVIATSAAIEYEDLAA